MAEEAGERKQGNKGMGLRAVVVAAVLLALAGTVLAVAARRPLAEHLLLRQLREAGFESASLAVEEVGPAALSVRDLRVGEGDLELRRLELRYSPGGLLRRRLDAVRAEGLRLRAALRGGELQLGALDALRPAPDGPPGEVVLTRLPVLPVDRVDVSDASLVLDTDFGPVAASLVAELHASEGGGLTLRADSLAVLGLEAADVVLEVLVEPVSRLLSGSLSVGSIRDAGPEPRFPPASLELRFWPEGEVVRFEGALEGTRGLFRMNASGSHALAAGAGRAQLQLEPIRFAEGGLAPGDLLPALGALIPSAAGSVEARGELGWSAAGIEGFLDVGLSDLALQTPAARLERINAAVRIDGPWPPRIPRGQLVSVARVDFGLELTRGIVSYGIRQDGVLELDTAVWSFAGGTIRTAGAIDLFAGEKQILLTVEDVDLAQLLELVNLEGLSGEGRLGGRLPLTLRHGNVLIRQALLESSEEGGWIRYRPEGSAAALGLAGQALDDLLQALRNFRFERLSLAVDGDAQQALVVAVSLSGANPEHRDGQPYNFNLNVDGRLADLIRQSTSAYQIPQRIEEKLDEIAAGRR